MEETDHRRPQTFARAGGQRKLRKIVASRECAGGACDHHATNVLVNVGAFQSDRHRLVHRGGQRVLLVRTVHPHCADRPLIGDADMIAHAVNAASAAFTLSAPSVTARSSPEACTAMFSEKKRAMAVRDAGSPLAIRSAASASSAKIGRAS